MPAEAVAKAGGTERETRRRFRLAGTARLAQIASMKFTAALSVKQHWPEITADLAGQVRAEFGAAKTDLALLFAHPNFIAELGEDVRALRQAIGARHLVGCTGAGIIGVEHEIENRPAVSVLVAQLPDVELTTFHITAAELEESNSPEYWHFQLEVDPDTKPNFVVLMDPFTLQPVTRLIDELAEAYRDAPIVGGLASGAREPGENRLFIDDDVFDEGAVGVALTGQVRLQTIVSQGCRPVGEPLVITRAEQNIIFELGGQRATDVLDDLLPKLTARDQQLARNALFLGRVIDEYKEDFTRGDFLIRQLIGGDRGSGALAVGDWIRTGQTVQFQVRDGKTADEDLTALLEQYRGASKKQSPRGAVLFSCLGRGEGMYGAPNHDITALHQHLGPVPTAGFFCNGEIGPVGERPFVHGFTSVIGLFSEPSPATK